MLRTELPLKRLKNEKIHKFDQNISALIFLVLFNFFLNLCLNFLVYSPILVIF